MLATGGSGHAYKFAPVLGELIADVALEQPTRYAEKFRWRPTLAPTRSDEAARNQ